jgi:hypothetical protein
MASSGLFRCRNLLEVPAHVGPIHSDRVVLWLSIAFARVSIASLVGTLAMSPNFVFGMFSSRSSHPNCNNFLRFIFFGLLFTGFLINPESLIPALRWLYAVSFFRATFGALAVNGLRYLQLKDIRIVVPETLVRMTTVCTSVQRRARLPGYHYSPCFRTPPSGYLPCLTLANSIDG